MDSVSTLLEVGVRHFCGRIRPVTWRQALGPLVGCGRGRIVDVGSLLAQKMYVSNLDGYHQTYDLLPV